MIAVTRRRSSSTNTCSPLMSVWQSVRRLDGVGAGAARNRGTASPTIAVVSATAASRSGRTSNATTRVPAPRLYASSAPIVCSASKVAHVFGKIVGGFDRVAGDRLALPSARPLVDDERTAVLIDRS